MAAKPLYKVIFHNHGKVYELFARSASSSGLYGFVEIGELVFEDDSAMVIDPTEERMREEFADVRTLHLPMHSVIRVEEVDRRGACTIRDSESGEKVTPFPIAPGKKPG
ncbi:MAG: DUF1820 family protein [Pseudomonadota bacterium]